MKKRNIITALSLLSPLAPISLHANSMFEDFKNISEVMHQSFARHMQEMEDIFAGHSKFFATQDTKTPSLDIATKETDAHVIVTLTFKNASPKDGTCKIEFEDTPNGTQLMRILWELTSKQETTSTQDKKSQEKEPASEKSAAVTTTQNYSMKFARTLLLSTPVETEQAEIKQIDDHTVQVSLPKINKRKTIHINL